MDATQDKVLPVYFDGKHIEARVGDSVAATLIANGLIVNRYTRQQQPRGLFCGMGICADCLVTIDGKRSQRACMTSVWPDMQIQTQREDDWQDDTELTYSHDEHSDEVSSEPQTQEIDLLVVGAGPAGLNAALVASQFGLHVFVIDERHESGGQYFKPRTAGYRDTKSLDDQHRRGIALRKQIDSSAVKLGLGETLWYARQRESDNSFDLRTFASDGQRRYLARTVVLATGAVEQAAIVPGWTLPGVMTIGAGQTLIRRYGIPPGRRVLVAGNGPLGMQLAYELELQGTKVVALLERARPSMGYELLRACWYSPKRLIEAVRYRLYLMLRRVPVLYAHEVVGLTGERCVQHVQAASLDTGAMRSFDVDAVCMGDGFGAQLELARLLGCKLQVSSGTGQVLPLRTTEGATNVAGLWIAGDAGGLAGADAAEVQGRLAGWEVQRYCAHSTPCDRVNSVASASLFKQRTAMRKFVRAGRFQESLWRLYQARARALPEGDTVICRCEELSCQQVSKALDKGVTSLASLKAATRLGMGRCQGRYCVPIAVQLLAQRSHETGATGLFAPQVPVRPVPVSALHYEKPEWRGHRQSSPAARPTMPRVEPLSIDRADIVVIGAGVTGISAALFAAQAGARVVVLDRGLANAEASGGNAGSLHLQLLSWDFGSKAAGDGSAALATLELQNESIALWRTLEAQLNADFEMQTTGGMMVAESVNQIEFLERKVHAENSVGIDSSVIDARRMRQIMPAIAERMVAAAWCPGEGKINPLLATPLLVQAARLHGAVIEEQAAVTAITKTGSEYNVHTPVGTVQTPRIIVAAGGWSAKLGEMLGISIPVRGAPLQMIVTEPAPALVPCLLAHADRHLTLKQANAGSLIIGGAWTAETSWAGHARVLPDSLEGNLWVASRTVPRISDLHVLRSWAAMNIDIDGAPLLGAVPGQPGIVVAATANGYTLGPVMGREAAAIALNGTVPTSIQRFGFERLQ